MIEIVKKTFLAGAGLAHKTWDEVEVLANEVVKKAKMGEKESAKFLKDLKRRYDDTQKKLEKNRERYFEKDGYRDGSRHKSLAKGDSASQKSKKQLRHRKTNPEHDC